MVAKVTSPVAIVGAGLAGLAAARYLRSQGVPVQLFEAGKRIAGLARSEVDAEGFTYDFGAHFITNRLAAEVGIADQCRPIRFYGEAVFLKDRYHSYPLGLMAVPRYALSGLKAKLSRTDPSKIATAADYFRAAYGRALADEVALPLLQEWSGAPADELSPAVGMGTPDNILETLYLTMARRLTRKPIAIHYCRELPDSRRVWHVYPDGGIGRLCEHLAEDLNDAIHLESPVEHIQVENNRVVSVRAAGRDYPASAAVSTAPYFVLAKLVRGTDALAHLTKFRYRPMVFVNLRMRGRDLLPQIIVWTPEDRFPFFRVAEGPLAAPWLAPEGKTVLTADIGCQVGDDVWTMPDDKLGEWCIDHLSPIVPNARERYLGCRVLRTPFAYPVFLNEYEAERQQLERSLGVGGLYSVGRNGEFAHILMEDVYWRTIRKMERLRAELIA